MGALGIPAVGLAGITKSLSSETLRAWESLIYGARYGHVRRKPLSKQRKAGFSPQEAHLLT